MIDDNEILSATILIVDDQRANVSLLEELLSDAGYRSVSATTDPYAVCDMHRTNHYDLILLDLEMPGMDGFAVMAGLNQIGTDDYVPILVITAQPEHKLRALSSGAKDFIAKPFDLVEVKTRIHNMLEVRLLLKKLANYNKILEQTVLERTAELRESETRFRRLTEMSSDWYWEQNVQGEFTKVYGPALEMLGIQSQKKPSLPKRIDQGPHWCEMKQKELDEHIAARQPFLDFVYSRTKPDGSQQYLMVSGEPMFDPAGKFTGYRGIGKDVTNTLHGGEAAAKPEPPK
ncbi:MAG: response regulator [Sideroxydans sp.]